MTDMDNADLAQSIIKAAEAAALRMAAAEVICACEGRDAVLAVPSKNSADRWRACGEANCDAITAQSILALISDDQSSALDAYVKAKVDEARAEERERAATVWVDMMDAYDDPEKAAAAIRAMKE